MPRIFISYRRADSAMAAGRLYDHLVDHFGDENVFMDIDDIPPGEDFVQVLERAIATCDHVLVVIGPDWLSSTDDIGRERLADPSDFVRLEIAAALERGARVIPVLVSGARMPSARDLPPDLDRLARRQAVRLANESFRYDVGRLIAAIEQGEPVSPPPSSPDPAGHTPPFVTGPDTPGIANTPPPADPAPRPVTPHIPVPDPAQYADPVAYPADPLQYPADVPPERPAPAWLWPVALAIPLPLIVIALFSGKETASNLTMANYLCLIPIVALVVAWRWVSSIRQVVMFMVGLTMLDLMVFYHGLDYGTVEAIIAGIIAGVIFGLPAAIPAAVVVWWRERQRRPEKQKHKPKRR